MDDAFVYSVFGKIDLDPVNKRVAVSERDIPLLCENTPVQSAPEISLQCVKAFCIIWDL